MQYTSMPQCGVCSGQGLWDIYWACTVVGCVLFGKGAVLGMYALDSSVSKCAQWKGEEEGCIYSVGSTA